MKKYISISLIFLFVLINTTIALADETVTLESKTNISIDKVWEIKFTLPVNEKYINDNILVLDEENNIVSTKLTVDQTGKIVSVDPLNDYKYSTKYYILVKNGLKSKDSQKSLMNTVKMEFITENQTTVETGIKEKVLGTWRTSYSGINANVSFNEDNTCYVKASIASAPGTYSISGDTMTMNLMGRQKTGRVVFEGSNKFIILSGDGSSMVFTR